MSMRSNDYRPRNSPANAAASSVPKRQPGEYLSHSEKRPRFLQPITSAHQPASQPPPPANEDVPASIIKRMLDREQDQKNAKVRRIGTRVMPGTSSITEYQFTENDKLGSGTFGVVLNGRHIQTGRKVALKRIVTQSKWHEEGVISRT